MKRKTNSRSKCNKDCVSDMIKQKEQAKHPIISISPSLSTLFAAKISVLRTTDRPADSVSEIATERLSNVISTDQPVSEMITEIVQTKDENKETVLSEMFSEEPQTESSTENLSVVRTTDRPADSVSEIATERLSNVISTDQPVSEMITEIVQTKDENKETVLSEMFSEEPQTESSTENLSVVRTTDRPADSVSEIATERLSNVISTDQPVSEMITEIVQTKDENKETVLSEMFSEEPQTESSTENLSVVRTTDRPAGSVSEIATERLSNVISTDQPVSEMITEIVQTKDENKETVLSEMFSEEPQTESSTENLSVVRTTDRPAGSVSEIATERLSNVISTDQPVSEMITEIVQTKDENKETVLSEMFSEEPQTESSTENLSVVRTTDRPAGSVSEIATERLSNVISTDQPVSEMITEIVQTKDENKETVLSEMFSEEPQTESSTENLSVVRTTDRPAGSVSEIATERLSNVISTDQPVSEMITEIVQTKDENKETVLSEMFSEEPQTESSTENLSVVRTTDRPAGSVSEIATERLSNVISTDQPVSEMITEIVQTKDENKETVLTKVSFRESEAENVTDKVSVVRTTVQPVSENDRFKTKNVTEKYSMPLASKKPDLESLTNESIKTGGFIELRTSPNNTSKSDNISVFDATNKIIQTMTANWDVLNGKLILGII